MPYHLFIRRLFRACLILAWLAAGSTAWAQLAQQSPALDIHTELFRLPADAPAQVGGAPYLAVVSLDPPKGQYIYGNTPGGMGLPTTAEVKADDATPTVLYPPGEAKADVFDPGQTVYVYEGQTHLFIPLAAPPANFELTVSGLLCSSTACLPFSEKRSLRFEVPRPEALPQAQSQAWWPELASAKPGVAPPEPQAPPAVQDEGQVQEWHFSPRSYQPGLEVSGLVKAALLAFLAGLLLNFMPCVLPVASLKLKGIVSGCVEGVTDNPIHCFRCYNIWFALGILVYFLVLSGIIAYAGLVWGQIFQSPSFILGMALLVFAMGLSLSGLFDLPVIDLKSPPGEAVSRRSAFLTGVLATLLATPCSGPFLGGVLAWALIQPPLVIATVFACIGLGMASPYLFMAARPSLITPFQRPGSWTLYVERVAAFLLFGTCVYLLQVLPQRLLWRALVALLATAFAGWMWGGWTNLAHSAARRFLTRLPAAALVVAAFLWALNPPPPSTHWQSFTPETLAASLGKERLLLDFTADWCPNCKFLELTTLSDANLENWAEEYGLKYMKVDLTEQNPAAESLLEAMGARSIPVVAVIPDGPDADKPLVLRDLFTHGTLDQALAGMFEKR